MSHTATSMRGTLTSLAAALVATISLGCIAAHVEPHHGPDHVAMHHGFSDDRSTVQVVSALVGKKNVYIPSTIVVTAGSGRTLNVHNATDTPHGFRIAGLGVETILQPGADTLVALPPLSAHAIYGIDCQLHPPHRHATLVVLPARP
jgi:hypothetical protein